MSELHIRPEPGTTELRHSQTTKSESETRSLSGKLADPIATAEWHIHGGIATAVDCYLNRKGFGAIDAKNSHFVVSASDQQISFVENENMVVIRKSYHGSLKPSKEILALQINEEQPMGIAGLRKLLKRHRHLFSSDEVFLKLLVALNAPKLSSTITSEEDTDNKGNKSVSHSVQNLSSNIPQSFVMRIPLFAADAETHAVVPVEINFMHEKHQAPVFWLESFELQLQQVQAAQEIVERQVSRLQELTDVPAIIYK